MRFWRLVLSLLLAFQLVVPAMQQVDPDDRIYDEVRRRLTNDPDVKGGTFEYEVKDGVVTIRGEVDKEKWRHKAERLAKKVKGVRQVVNQLKVKNQ
jgi:osmotically-inducible protein OsmY